MDQAKASLMGTAPYELGSLAIECILSYLPPEQIDVATFVAFTQTQHAGASIFADTIATHEFPQYLD